MAINPLYIPLFTIEEVILDKDSGLPLSGGVVTFYRDSQRLTPKPVYQIAGVSPNYTFVSVGNELTLGNAGDFVDTNGNPFVPYAYPYDSDGNVDLYYVTVVSQGAVSQFVRQAVPYIPAGSVSPGDLANDGNEISNPQFVEVLFPQVGATTLAVSGSNTVTPIAPGWDLITTGSGNVVVERLEPVASNVPTNPPYSLRIDAEAGLGATVTLRQRIYNTPSIFRGGFASATFTAAVISGGGSAISMSYAPSLGTASTLIPNTAISTDGAYHTVMGNNSITVQANDPASIGYVDILITIPTGRNIAITSIQVVGLSFSTDLAFDEQTAARQKDHLFHYYENGVVRQPKSNLVTGWIFAQNPYQFNTTSLNLVSPATAYTTDQTIIHTEADVSLQVGQASAAEGYGYKILAVNTKTSNRFCVIQYIDPVTVRASWSQILASMVRARIFTTHDTHVHIKMRLIYRTTLPSTLGAAEPIASWAPDSNPVFSAGWTALTPVDDPSYLLPNAYDTSVSPGAYPSFPFERFALPAASTKTMTLGIVLYTMDNMNESLGTEDYIVLDRISLVQNDFAIDSPPESFDETLRKCQYYYEKSYDIGVAAGTITNIGQKQYPTFINTSGGTSSLYIQSFTCDFMQVKRAIPSAITFYSPTSGTSNLASVQINHSASALTQGNVVASTAWQLNPAVTSTERFQMLSLNTATPQLSSGGGALGDEGIINYHYLADSRLGV